jgi:hypothetical protein
MAYTHQYWERRSLVPFKSHRSAYGITEAMLDDFKQIVMKKAELYEQTYFRFMHQTPSQAF